MPFGTAPPSSGMEIIMSYRITSNHGKYNDTAPVNPQGVLTMATSSARVDPTVERSRWVGSRWGLQHCTVAVRACVDCLEVTTSHVTPPPFRSRFQCPWNLSTDSSTAPHQNNAYGNGSLDCDKSQEFWIVKRGRSDVLLSVVCVRG